jgi:Fe-coproporphyrin III synthase
MQDTNRSGRERAAAGAPGLRACAVAQTTNRPARRTYRMGSAQFRLLPGRSLAGVENNDLQGPTAERQLKSPMEPLNSVAAGTTAPDAALQRLPLVTLYLTERCNSRCVTCDYWRHGRVDMNLESVQRLLPSLAQLRTRAVLVSGGEPLLNPQWADIAQLLNTHGMSTWLLTSGLSLAKHARRAAQLFDAITVSMDGTNARTYAAIRGLDAFDKVCEGIAAAAEAGARVSLRVTLQRANYRELPAFVDLARQAGACQISFLAVDVANPHAFGRSDAFASDLALQPQDLPLFEQLLCSLEQQRAEDFHSGFIAESPQKLRRILQYFTAVCGQGPYPAVLCNAPEFSAVIDAHGRVQPCFFIGGPAQPKVVDDLPEVLNGAAMVSLRRDIRQRRRAECNTCVCSMWREPSRLADSGFGLALSAAV